MLETQKPFIAVLALALLAAVGCYNFDQVFDDCVNAGRCKPTECDPSAADAPDDLFFDNNCDGMDGMADGGVFVDPRNGQDTATAGNREHPYQTLTYALRQMPVGTATVYLAQGTYDEPGLRLDKPVSLHGGYSGVEGSWARASTNVTQFGGGSIGLTVSGLGPDAGVTLEWLHIKSGTSPDAGAPSIGLRVLDSSGVRLRHVDILAGAGTNGADGANGDSPVSGSGDGGVGGSVDSSTSAGGAAGPAGLGVCGASASNGGGAGGIGGSQYAFGDKGQTGTPGATGGDGGAPQLLNCSTSACECIGNAGGDGVNGGNGDAGVDGEPGDNLGLLVPDAGTWVAKSATDGKAGTLGGGGGGGGGGGHCQTQATGNASLGYATSEGSGGGGGGAGGCPGQGGVGGKGGGASIAMVLVNSHVELESCALQTTGGGAGGAGGSGGNGGNGGQGGLGGTSFTSALTVYPTSSPVSLKATGGKGGKGGNGGNGGNGGHGGNGSGGPSVGIWCGPGSSVNKTGTTTIVPGPAGLPGAGPGPKNTTEIRQETRDCP